MSFAQTNPTAHLWLDQASLGIDGLFGYSGDLLTQARILLQHIRHLFYTEVLARWKVPANTPMTHNQAFLVATRNGGLALRRPDLGILAAGAKADVLVWDSSNLAMLGWVDPVSAVLMHANVADIQDVLVDGLFKKRNGQLLAPGLDDARQKFVQSARRIQETTLALPRVEAKEDETFISGARVERLPLVDVLHGEGNGYVLDDKLIKPESIALTLRL